MDLIMLLKVYQTLCIGIITLIVLITGLTLTYRQLVSMKKSRHSELIMNLTTFWDSKPIFESRQAIHEIINAGEPLSKKLYECRESVDDFERYLILLRVGNFFEHMGWLVDKGYIEDSTEIIDLFGGPIYKYYKIYEDFISSERLKEAKKTHIRLYEYFERLADKAEKDYFIN